MSWKTLESFVNLTYDDNLCPEFHRAEEDQELSRCLAKINLTPSDARDSQGRDRFHQFHPEELNDFGRTIFMNRHSYYQFLGYPEHISPTTIGLHHLSPYEMRFMDFLVHKIEISDA
uniref:Uncharacterized protein n=1 Tax=Panagrolaimus sp. PS1159 TaxID=55785 RepID=A0AC35FD16_9BILA